METAGASKTNVGAAEIDPVEMGSGVEIRRGVKMRIGKIGGLLESAAGEIDFAIEARARKRDV